MVGSKLRKDWQACSKLRNSMSGAAARTGKLSKNSKDKLTIKQKIEGCINIRPTTRNKSNSSNVDSEDMERKNP